MSRADRRAVLVPSAAWQEAALQVEKLSFLEESAVCVHMSNSLMRVSLAVLRIIMLSASLLVLTSFGSRSALPNWKLFMRFTVTPEGCGSGETGRVVRVLPRARNSRQQSVKKPVFPSREKFGQLYQTLQAFARFPEMGTAERLAVMMGWPIEKIIFMLNVFEELEFLIASEGEAQACPGTL